MPGIDFTELLLIGVLVLLFVGPERLPHMTRMLGQTYGRLRRAADELRRAMVLEADRMDEEERLRGLVARRRAAEEARKRAAEDVLSGAPPSGEGAPVARPDPAVAAAASVTEGPVEDARPAGFSQAEWDELPENVREIVRRRRSPS